MLIGYFRHGTPAFGPIQCENLNRSPAEPAGAPTFKVYSPSGNLIEEGTAELFDPSNLTAAYRWEVDTGSNNYERGAVYVLFITYTVASITRVITQTFIVS